VPQSSSRSRSYDSARALSLTRAEALAQGYTIDDCCNPPVAYKGPRFQPTDWKCVPPDYLEPILLDPLRNDAANFLFALHDAWPYVHQWCTIESIKNNHANLMRKHGDFADLHRDVYLTKAQVVAFLEALHKDAQGQHNHYAYAARRISEEL